MKKTGRSFFAAGLLAAGFGIAWWNLPQRAADLPLVASTQLGRDIAKTPQRVGTAATGATSLARLPASPSRASLPPEGEIEAAVASTNKSDAAAKDALGAFLQQAVVPLSDSERELLAKYSESGLHEAIRAAEQVLMKAEDEDREEAAQRYDEALNLAAKFAEPGPEMPKSLEEAYDAYLATRQADAVKIDRLSPDDRRAAIDSLKEEILGPAEKALQASAQL